MRFLFIGDIIGKAGRQALFLSLAGLLKEHRIDFVIANGENIAGGFGVTPKITSALYSYGINVLTSGNHIWRNKEVFKIINSEKRLIRPINFPKSAPGQGSAVFEYNGIRIGVINAIGRVYMEAFDCPFRAVNKEAERMNKEGINVKILDFHAEATSEKNAMIHYMDGKLSAVFGTHTHVQTADARVFPGGTAFITDLGMTGPIDSIIGVKKEIIIRKFITGMPSRFEVAYSDAYISAAVCEIDPSTGKASEMYSFMKKVEIDGNRSDSDS